MKFNKSILSEEYIDLFIQNEISDDVKERYFF